MKTNINVLMIDDNESIISKTMEYFSSHAVINVVKTINNGKEGLDYILNNQNCKYGLKLEFVHDKSNFEPGSWPILDYIMKYGEIIKYAKHLGIA